MYKIFLCVICILTFLIRWSGLKSPLPESWTRESKIRLTATITEQVEYTDSQTIVRYGIWYIKMRGYAVIIPGSRVSFVGTVTPKLLGNKATQIVMVDPTFEVVGNSRCAGSLKVECGMVYLGQLRGKWVVILEKTLPEPMSSLAAGILLGVKSEMSQGFYEHLVATGTLHIVAASGFNVSIIATVLMSLLSRVLSRGVAIFFGIIGVILYALVAGGSASVVRAGIMGILTLIVYYFGRPAEAKRLLWVTGICMLFFDPLLIVNIGFQLSFAATAGILYIEPWIEKCSGTRRFLKDYLYPTLAATFATLPIILWHFGRVSFISPLVNMLVLPLVPLVMLLTSLILVGGQLAAYFAYLPLWWIVRVIELFG
jgi:ComEC/Rec2-related protein